MSRISGRVSRAKPMQRPGQPQGGAVGALQGQRLGDQLAEDDVQEGDEQEGQDGGDGVRGGAVPAGRQAEQRLEQLARAGSATKPRPMLARVMPSCVAAMERSRWRRRLDASGALDPLGDHLLDARPPHRDQGELGGHEQAVEDHQGRDGEQQPPRPSPNCHLLRRQQAQSASFPGDSRHRSTIGAVGPTSGDVSLTPALLLFSFTHSGGRLQCFS